MVVKKNSKNKSSINSNKTKSKSDNTTLCAVLSYFLIGVIWYVLDENMKKSNLVRRHARQGLVLLILSIGVSILSFALGFIPFLGMAISTVLNIGLLILWIIGILNALQNKDEPMVVIGEFAEKMSF